MQVETKIEISASPKAVYDQLMNFSSYPDWNPMVTSISGDATEGGKLEVDVKIGTGNAQKFQPIVLRNEPNKEFRWVGVLLTRFLFRGEHYFIIDDHGQGEDANSCTFTHGEKFSGLLIPIFKMQSGSELEGSFASFNNALKARVEGS